jgi:O-glycosyl hydrolase
VILAGALLAVLLTSCGVRTPPPAGPTGGSPTTAPTTAPSDGPGPADPGPADPSEVGLVVDASRRFQVMDGMGANVNVNSWNGGELAPALDQLTTVTSVFRLIRDPMDWVSDPADLAPLLAGDATTLARVYEQPEMQELWSTIAHLNKAGVGGNRIMLDFMGWTPVWMGGSGRFGEPSRLDPGREGDLATMISSLVHYGRTVRGLDFGLLAPVNEVDWDCKEGPCLPPDQYVRFLTELVARLDRAGHRDIGLVGPDTAGAPDDYAAAVLAEPSVAARMVRLAAHRYGEPAVPPDLGTSMPWWLTEAGAACPSCDSGGTPEQGEWAFAAGSGDVFLGSIANGFSAVFPYDAFDSFYFHHDSFGYWGQLAYDQGSGTYAPRKRFHVAAQLGGFVAPGSVRVATEDSIPALARVVAFVGPAPGRVTVVGRNAGGSDLELVGRLDGLTTVPAALDVHVTDGGSRDVEPQADVAVTGGTFRVTIPPDSFFTLSG